MQTPRILIDELYKLYGGKLESLTRTRGSVIYDPDAIYTCPCCGGACRKVDDPNADSNSNSDNDTDPDSISERTGC